MQSTFHKVDIDHFPPGWSCVPFQVPMLLLSANRRINPFFVLIQLLLLDLLSIVSFFSVVVEKECDLWFNFATFISRWQTMINRNISALIVKQSNLTCLFMTQHMKQTKLCMLNHFACVGLNQHCFSIFITVLLLYIFVATRFKKIRVEKWMMQFLNFYLHCNK